MEFFKDGLDECSALRSNNEELRKENKVINYICVHLFVCLYFSKYGIQFSCDRYPQYQCRKQCYSQH